MSIALVIGVSVLVAALVSSSVVPRSPSSRPSFDAPGAVLPEESLGLRVALSEAQQRAVFSIKLPQVLPPESTLDRVYVLEDGKGVTMFYKNPTLADVGVPFTFSAQIVIKELVRETNPVPQAFAPPAPLTTEVDYGNGTRKVFTQPQEPLATPLKVNGTDAFGVASRVGQAAYVVWWEKGVEYKIEADLPMTQLVAIAESMR